RYLVGAYIFGMPIEEWLFFLFIPYSCVFLYEVMRYYIRRDVFGKMARPFSILLALSFLAVGVFNLDRSYTSITFIATAAFLAYHIWARTPWLGRFYIGYAISL